MGKLKLLIVDDVEDNRLVLRAICKKLENFEIKEAEDGLEAVEITQDWLPDIILMDVMMPKMDGYEASKIIKNLYPQTVIIVVTAVTDPNMQKNMSEIGVDTYIHKPIDKELILFKLQSIGASIRLKQGQFKTLSKKNALNPFNSDIRSFRIIFDITDTESMMDFGMWLFDQCADKDVVACGRLDLIVELFYKLMRQGMKNQENLSIIVEESYEEIYITIKFENIIVLEPRMVDILNAFESEFIVQKNILCAKLKKYIEEKNSNFEAERTTLTEETIQEIVELKIVKEIHTAPSKERELLRQSFTQKTCAADYVSDIGGDIVDEILDLASLDEEWRERLTTFEEIPSDDNLKKFANGVLDVYAHTINSLFEFTALAYALTSLGIFLKEKAHMVVQDPAKIKTLIMLLENLGYDLVAWRKHIFELQDTLDIHYLDSSFFSSCMQIEGIMSNKEIDVDDDNDMEFF
ncbi:MAG: response regulator [Sulfurimonas sp.]|uniref:response regulator n=1 Tax=Sulfurimonas sp. TaxID=2022749 RepID=UPI00260D3005|nr:response regulator [Sulfurimonas sp.]MDD5373114.1 response regulator [Sulfurimonas sp.]